MKKVLLFFMLLSLTVACTAQSETPPNQAQAEVPANRARLDNKMNQDIEILLRIEDGEWIPETLHPRRSYVILNDCGIPNRLCKKELAVCTGTGTSNCHITELKGGTAYIVIWNSASSRWMLEEYKKD
jgi:hypothetical protein